MAAKRGAGQLLRLPPSVPGLQHPMPRVGVRTFSIVPRTIGKCEKRKRVESSPIPESARTRREAQCLPAPHRRYISTPSQPSGSKIYTFDDILSLLSITPAQTPTTPLLIDVREPHEYAANSIPTALNLPIASQPDALLLPPDEFLDRFGWAKPALDRPLVLFCKAGVRSRAGAGIAREAGYSSVGEYPGSWLDWEKRGGPGTKDPPPAGGRGEPELMQ